MKRAFAVLASVASAVALLFLGYFMVVPYGTSKARAQTTSSRPNIVFVMTDDMPERL